MSKLRPTQICQLLLAAHPNLLFPPLMHKIKGAATSMCLRCKARGADLVLDGLHQAVMQKSIGWGNLHPLQLIQPLLVPYICLFLSAIFLAPCRLPFKPCSMNWS